MKVEGGKRLDGTSLFCLSTLEVFNAYGVLAYQAYLLFTVKSKTKKKITESIIDTSNICNFQFLM